jgi:hypothetical protein
MAGVNIRLPPALPGIMASQAAAITVAVSSGRDHGDREAGELLNL